MPLFRFAVADANPPIVSDTTLLASIAAARGEALMFAGRVLSEQGESFWDEDDWVLTVSDEQNLTLFTITVATANAPATAKYSGASGT